MNEHDDALWRLLRDYCRGRANAMKMQDVARRLNITWREVAAAKHQLVVEHRRPIAAAKEPPYGIYIAETDEERERYITTLDATLRETYQLRRAFSKASVTELIRQEVFDFGKEG